MIVICVDVSSCDGSEETTMMMKMNKRKKNISSSYQMCVCVCFLNFLACERNLLDLTDLE